MFRSAKFRKAVYLASTPITLVLVTWGVRADNAAAYVGGALAVANIVGSAFLAALLSLLTSIAGLPEVDDSCQ